ncbi:YHS domain-containing (seleno)protein [Ekhidna sp.]|uniref:YHS domain-containing (seleno)protein n=1 Tax=Ekhidna sp. TaxID=2608089 RepID=UPI003299C216
MKKISTLLLAISLISSCNTVDAPKDEIYNIEGIALDGYDLVAYFAQGEAKKGVNQEVVNYNGISYQFSSTKNRRLFEENPEKYLPEYGGWCAYAVAETSTKMEPDPTQWQIQDGQLILFTSSWMTKLTGSLKEEWNQDPIDYEVRADANWDKMVDLALSH